MRSPREIAFRLNQEVRNVLLYALPPKALSLKELHVGLPEPESVIRRLRGTIFERSVIAIAEQTLRHEFPLLGLTIETGPDIHWRRDYVKNIESDIRYFRLVRYLDVNTVGDHKLIWELNRQQHLVALAQAYRFTGRREFIAEIEAQLNSWWNQNPFARGMNWTSALEVAFRALSWVWICHLAGNHLNDSIRGRLILELYRHGCYLENNLSIYFSPNTHLLGEAVALHTLGLFFSGTRRANVWERRAEKIVDQQLVRQVQADGSHFEQSTYYHVYALDMLLFHYIIRNRPREYDVVLQRMAEYLHAILGSAGEIDFLGDDDGGRFFHPYGCHSRYGRATLATCGILFNRPNWIYDKRDLHEQAIWWIGPGALDGASAGQVQAAPSKLFARSGVAVLTAGDVRVMIDAGGFGPWGAGHSHSDTLSITARVGAERILVDAGTYTYVGDIHWRNWFRGSAAHNTIRINSLDQAELGNPFRWNGRPEPRIREWRSCDARDYIDAEYTAGTCTHRRRVWFEKPYFAVVRDSISGTPGEHLIEQFWHLGDRAHIRHIVFPDDGDTTICEEGGENGWHSPTFGRKQAAVVLRRTRKAVLPAEMIAVIALADDLKDCRIYLDKNTVRVIFAGSAYTFET